MGNLLYTKLCPAPRWPQRGDKGCFGAACPALSFPKLLGAPSLDGHWGVTISAATDLGQVSPFCVAIYSSV